MSIIHDALKKVDAGGFNPQSARRGLFAQTQEDSNVANLTFLLLLGLFLLASISWAYFQKTGRSIDGQYPPILHETKVKSPVVSIAPQDGYLKNGIALYRAGRLDDALAQLRLALEETPDNPVVHNNIGAVYAAKNEYLLAEQFFIKASVNQDYAEAFNNRGAVIVKLGRIEEAIGHFKKALSINPGYADAHLNLAAACEKSGDAENALAHYRTYLDLSADTENRAIVSEKIPALTGVVLRKHR